MKSVFALLATAAVAIAQAVGDLAINDFPHDGAVAGRTYRVTYTAPDQTKPVIFLLRHGDPNNLVTVETITTTVTGGVFNWTPSTSLVNGDDYAVQIQQDDSINWIGPFPISGGSDEAVETDHQSTTNHVTVTDTNLTTATPDATVTDVTVIESGVAQPTGTGAVGTTVIPRPSGSGVSTARPTKTSTPGQGDDDEPPSFDGAASKFTPAFAAVVLGAVALLA